MPCVGKIDKILPVGGVACGGVDAVDADIWDRVGQVLRRRRILGHRQLGFGAGFR